MSLAYFRSGLGDYFFDVEFSENHDFENTITQNPVMSGSPANDFVYRQPIVITLDVGISDCLVSNYFNSSVSRSSEAYEVLLNLYQSATLVNVYTGLNVYQNMVVKSVNIKRDNTLMHSMRATVVMQELITVGQESISISADPNTTDSTNGGTKSASKTESSVFSSSSSKVKGAVSTLSEIYNWVISNPATKALFPFLP